MNGIQTNFFQALGVALINSLWQLGLLWVIYQVIANIIKTKASSNRFTIALYLLITGFVWVTFTFFEAYFTKDSTGTIVTTYLPESINSESIFSLLQHLYPAIALLYLVLLFIPVKQYIKNYRYVQALRTYGLSKMDVDKRLFVDIVSARLGIAKKVKVWISEFVASPATIGFLKPIILIPAAAITNLTPMQIESVLLHELAHIKRNDYIINLLTNAIRTILYFNPFVKAFVRIIEKERERSCDELVLQFQYDSKDYATALLTLEKEQQQKALAIAASGRATDLIHRVELILGIAKRPIIPIYKITGAFATVLFVLIIQSSLFVSSKKETGYKLANLSYQIANPSLTITRTNQNTELAINTANNQPLKARNILQPSTISADAIFYRNTAPVSEFMNVVFEEKEIPELKKYQEEQVKKALENTKRILENAEWEKVEGKIAEVLNTQEKEELKASYLKQWEKLDWNQWENKLKIAYNKIDWDRVNSQLSVAISQIKTDSLQQVYNEASTKLNAIEIQLKENQLKGIPDSGISLEEIEIKKELIQKAIDQLKDIRQKKIVSL